MYQQLSILSRKAVNSTLTLTVITLNMRKLMLKYSVSHMTAFFV